LNGPTDPRASGCTSDEDTELARELLAEGCGFPKDAMDAINPYGAAVAMTFGGVFAFWLLAPGCGFPKSDSGRMSEGGLETAAGCGVDAWANAAVDDPNVMAANDATAMSVFFINVFLLDVFSLTYRTGFCNSSYKTGSFSKRLHRIQPQDREQFHSLVINSASRSTWKSVESVWLV